VLSEFSPTLPSLFVLTQRRRTGESRRRLPSAGTSNVTPSPLVAPHCCTPLVVHSGWLSCRFSSRHSLLSACASVSHRTAASHCAPLAPLVRLVTAAPLVTPPSPVRLCLRLSSNPPIIAPLLRLFSGWLSRHLSSRTKSTPDHLVRTSLVPDRTKPTLMSSTATSGTSDVPRIRRSSIRGPYARSLS
jgi:hypothetical protein